MVYTKDCLLDKSSPRISPLLLKRLPSLPTRSPSPIKNQNYSNILLPPKIGHSLLLRIKFASNNSLYKLSPIQSPILCPISPSSTHKIRRKFL